MATERQSGGADWRVLVKAKAIAEQSVVSQEQVDRQPVNTARSEKNRRHQENSSLYRPRGSENSSRGRGGEVFSGKNEKKK